MEVPTTPPIVTPSPAMVAETKIDSAKPVLAYEEGKTAMEISKAKKAIEEACLLEKALLTKSFVARSIEFITQLGRSWALNR
jgi:hypothetical protein